jgi:hypothetical protein
MTVSLCAESGSERDEGDAAATDGGLFVDNEQRWLVFVRKDVKKRLIKQSVFAVAQVRLVVIAVQSHRTAL